MRAPIRLAAVLLVLSLAAAACGDDGEVGDDLDVDTSSTTTTTTAPATPGEEEPGEDEPAEEQPGEEVLMVNVALPDYPWWDNTVMAAAPDRLDSLATAYVAEVGEEAQMERFLFGEMPVIVFDEIFAGDVEPATTGELFWLLHLSGYFGGRWLRGEIAAAQPEALLVGFSVPPTEEAFRETVEAAQVRLDLSDGDDEAVIAAARDALFDKPPPAEGEDPVSGLTDSFGYNVGYMLEILASPPEGVAASPQFEVTCDGLLSCDYASPKLAVLAELADLIAALNSDDPPEPELVAELLPVQAAAEPRGRGVWSGGLSVQGFSAESYDQLLDVSSSFLQTAQASALTNVRAVIDGDPDAAFTGLVAEAGQIVWLSGYIAGLTNGEGDIELPDFVF